MLGESLRLKFIQAVILLLKSSGLYVHVLHKIQCAMFILLKSFYLATNEDLLPFLLVPLSVPPKR